MKDWMKERMEFSKRFQANQTTQPKEDNMISKAPRPWSIQDEAIHRGYNYGVAKHEIIKELLREGASIEAVLKNAYQEGFLHGFEHKFDQTNYEEK